MAEREPDQDAGSGAAVSPPRRGLRRGRGQRDRIAFDVAVRVHFTDVVEHGMGYRADINVNRSLILHRRDLRFLTQNESRYKSSWLGYESGVARRLRWRKPGVAKALGVLL